MPFASPLSSLLAIGLIAFVWIVLSWEIVFIFLTIMRKIPGKLLKDHFKEEKYRKLISSKPAWLMHILFIFVIICLFWGYLVEPYRLHIERIQVETKKIAAGSTVRIVHLTDSHSVGRVRNEAKVTELVTSLNPDIVVFTGDVLSAPEGLPMFKEMMKPLSAQGGIFGVKGNWDEWYWNEMDLFGGTPIKELKSDHVNVTIRNQTISVIGIGFGREILLEESIEGIHEEQYKILLYHKPDEIKNARDLGIDLYLTGHTHGGQIRLPFYGAMMTLSDYGKKYESGLFREGDTTMYVSRGIGTEDDGLLRARFLCPPEITYIEIIGTG